MNVCAIMLLFESFTVEEEEEEEEEAVSNVLAL